MSIPRRAESTGAAGTAGAWGLGDPGDLETVGKFGGQHLLPYLPGSDLGGGAGDIGEHGMASPVGPPDGQLCSKNRKEKRMKFTLVGPLPGARIPRHRLPSPEEE